jgi:hypothetical protein
MVRLNVSISIVVQRRMMWQLATPDSASLLLSAVTSGMPYTKTAET